MANRILFRPGAPAPEMQLSFTPGPAAEPPHPDSPVSLEKELFGIADDPDTNSRLSKMAQLFRSRSPELRQRWGDEKFAARAARLQSAIGSTALQLGEQGPGQAETFFENADAIPTLPAEIWSHMTTPLAEGEFYETLKAPFLDKLLNLPRVLAPESYDDFSRNLQQGNAQNVFANSVAKTGQAIGDAVLQAPSLIHAAGHIAGNLVDKAIMPAGEQATVGQQVRGLFAPVQTFAEVTSSMPAQAAMAAGYDPNALPGILARSDAYLQDLGRRMYEQPSEPVFGAAMLGGAAQVARAVPEKVRMFQRPTPPAVAPPGPAPQPIPAQPPLPTTPAAGQAFVQGSVPAPATRYEPPAPSEIPPPGMPRSAYPNPVPEYTMPTQPIDWNGQRPTVEPSNAPQPQPAKSQKTLQEVRDSVRNTVPAREVFDQAKPEPTAPAKRYPTRPTSPAVDDSPGAISFDDVDAMIKQASKGEVKVQETGLPNGKKRLLMRSGDGPGTVRLLGRKGRSSRRSGAIAIPSIDQLKQAIKSVADATVAGIERVVSPTKAEPAPAPGSPGGPGTGVPFEVHVLKSTLKPAPAPKTSLGYYMDMALNPAALNSFFHRTGLVDMAIEANRIANVMNERAQSFLWGNQSGKAWLKKEFQKAGPDLWSAVIAKREGRAWTPTEQAAVNKYSHAYNQFVGPAFQFLDHVRSLGVYRDLGPNFWPYDWGHLAEVNKLVGEGDGGFRPEAKGSGVTSDRQRTTMDAPLRNPVTVMDEYAASITDKFTRHQMMEKIGELKKQVDTRGKMMLDGYGKGVLFKSPQLLDAEARKYQLNDELKKPVQIDQQFNLDGSWGLDGRLKVTGEAYESERGGQTYNVEINGREWPIAFTAAELNALRLGEKLPDSKSMTKWINKVNSVAALRSIALNTRSFWRQITGGQARFAAEAAMGDYAFGHSQAAKYWTGKLPEAEMQMLKESGVLEGETSVEGLDQRASKLRKALMSNVYIPDQHTIIASWFSEWNRLGRDEPGLSKEARMDKSTSFALRVSDANMKWVQSPYADNPGLALVGLFQRSKLRQLRHLMNMDTTQKAKFGGTLAAVSLGMKMLGDLDYKEWMGVLTSELPFGDYVAGMAGLPQRHQQFVGAAGLDVVGGYLYQLAKTYVDVMTEDKKAREVVGHNDRDALDDIDRIMRKVFPLQGAYRAVSDGARVLFGGRKASETSRKSLFTAPSKPYVTRFEKMQRMRSHRHQH